MKIDTKPLRLAELQSRLSWYEHAYGVPSSRLAEAFRVEGKLVETSDFTAWSGLYAAYRVITRGRAA